MPIGLILIGWDDMQGSYVEARYPETVPADEAKITQYLMTIQSLSTTRNVELTDGQRVVLIYGLPARKRATRDEFNYRFLVLLLNEDERPDVPRYRVELESAGLQILTTGPFMARKELFSHLVKRVFKEETRKIVFVGFPNAGKTSTKRFFFDKVHEDHLLGTTLEPTVGYETSFHQLIDMGIALFDAAGQELDAWFHDSKEVVLGADLLVFFFSVTDWQDRPDKVKDYLRLLAQFREENQAALNQVSIFCHKIDVVVGEAREHLQEAVRELARELGLPVFFTSIKEGGNPDLVIGIQLLYEQFSSFLSSLETLLFPLVDLFDVTPLALLDAHYRPVVKYPGDQENPLPLALLVKWARGIIAEIRDTGSHSTGPAPGSPVVHVTYQPTLESPVMIVLDVRAFHESLSLFLLSTRNLAVVGQFLAKITAVQCQLQWPEFALQDNA